MFTKGKKENELQRKTVCFSPVFFLIRPPLIFIKRKQPAFLDVQPRNTNNPLDQIQLLMSHALCAKRERANHRFEPVFPLFQSFFFFSLS